MKLLTPIQLGDVPLRSRIVMAPMSRCRAAQPGNVPTELNAEYYAQRASAGLIITEATQVSPQGQGYSFTPGIHSEMQVCGWKLVTDAVHAEGGKIFLQLWHVGRMSHPVFHDGGKPVAPSAISPDARVWISDENGPRMVECPVPRALEASEIQEIVEDFRMGARNALAAGFDGVEIHGANGYLIDQFLRTTSNTRTDEYGGSQENRMRFALEVARAVAKEAGAGRTGIRLAPFIKARGMDCPEISGTILKMAKEMHRIGLAYLHLSEADWDDAPVVPESFRHELRRVFPGPVIVAGNYRPDSAEKLIADGLADLAAFGRPFIANPNLPELIARNFPWENLRAANPDALFGGTEQGYSDFPETLVSVKK